MWRILAVASLLSACAGDPLTTPATLADLPALVIDIRADGTTLRATLGYDEDVLGACATLPPDFRVTVDDTPMTVSHGDVTDIGIDSPDYVCVEPYAHAAVEPRDVAVLHIGDDSRAIDVDLGDALAERTIQLESGTQWTFARGDSFELSWLPAGDLASHPPTVRLHTPMRDRVETIVLDTVVNGPRLRVRLPSAAELPFNGNATLELLMYVRIEPVCAARCALHVTRRFEQPVVIR